VGLAGDRISFEQTRNTRGDGWEFHFASSTPIDRFIELTCSLPSRFASWPSHGTRPGAKPKIVNSAGLFDNDEVRQSVVHARQDLKLIAFLGAIVLMLGVVADRVH
jgi:hypothetical protein